MGVDPGLAATGWAVLHQLDASSPAVWVDGGVLRTSARDGLSLRLKQLFESFSQLIERQRPDAAAMEELFFLKAARTVVGTGQARGVLLLACVLKGVPVHEYNPRSVKMALTGNGNASKQQMLQMVRRLFHVSMGAQWDDVADAAAIAHIHLRFRKFEEAVVRN